VAKGRVLVIDGDEWLAPLLARMLVEAGWTAEVATSARAGFEKACAWLPDCIVCALTLPDIDGFWVARRIRTEAGLISKTPFMFVDELPDREVRVQALHVGADMVLARPVTNEDIVAQVEALIAMSRRVRGDREDDSSRESLTSLTAAGTALRGDMSLFPLASLLMMLEMERRSGTLDVKSSAGTRATLVIVGGLFADTDVGGQPMPAIEALREVLSWRAGTFAFRPKDVGTLPAPRASVGAVVLEAMRLEDERR
jgi:DNA-binding response OmpR family regulator